MNRKKTLLISIIAVILLIALVIGVSYAMYKFSGTGTKENSISTGTVSVVYMENSMIELTNQYPSSDAIGSANAETLEFTVSANISGSMNVKYDLGITNIVEGHTLTSDYVKFCLKKGNSYLLNTTEDSGITIASRKNIAGGNGLIPNYALDSGMFNITDNVTYVLKAWVSDSYKLPTTDTSVGNVHSNATNSETFKFKISVVASQ